MSSMHLLNLRVQPTTESLYHGQRNWQPQQQPELAQPSQYDQQHLQQHPVQFSPFDPPSKTPSVPSFYQACYPSFQRRTFQAGLVRAPAIEATSIPPVPGASPRLPRTQALLPPKPYPVTAPQIHPGHQQLPPVMLAPSIQQISSSLSKTRASSVQSVHCLPTPSPPLPRRIASTQQSTLQSHPPSPPQFPLSFPTPNYSPRLTELPFQSCATAIINQAPPIWLSPASIASLSPTSQPPVTTTLFTPLDPEVLLQQCRSLILSLDKESTAQRSSFMDLVQAHQNELETRQRNQQLGVGVNTTQQPMNDYDFYSQTIEELTKQSQRDVQGGKIRPSLKSIRVDGPEKDILRRQLATSKANLTTTGWRVQQERNINSSLNEEQKKAKVCKLLMDFKMTQKSKRSGGFETMDKNGEKYRIAKELIKRNKDPPSNYLVQAARCVHFKQQSAITLKEMETSR